MTQCRLGADMCPDFREGQLGPLAALGKVAWARPFTLSTSKIIKVKFKEDTKGRMMRKRRTGGMRLSRNHTWFPLTKVSTIDFWGQTFFGTILHIGRHCNISGFKMFLQIFKYFLVGQYQLPSSLTENHCSSVYGDRVCTAMLQVL